MGRTHDDHDNGTGPTFDFSTYSHKEARLYVLETKRLQHLDKRLNDPASFEDEGAFEDALAEFDRLMGQLDAVLCRVVTSVPRDWLIDDAPADLDWSQSESLAWLRQDRYEELQALAAEAKKPESVSKNSARR